MPWNYPSWSEWLMALVTFLVWILASIACIGLGIVYFEDHGAKLEEAGFVVLMGVLMLCFGIHEFLWPAGYGSDWE